MADHFIIRIITFMALSQGCLAGLLLILPSINQWIYYFKSVPAIDFIDFTQVPSLDG